MEGGKKKTKKKLKRKENENIIGKVGGYLALCCASLHADNFDLSIRSNLNAISIQYLRHTTHTHYTCIYSTVQKYGFTSKSPNQGLDDPKLLHNTVSLHHFPNGNKRKYKFCDSTIELEFNQQIIYGGNPCCRRASSQPPLFLNSNHRLSLSVVSFDIFGMRMQNDGDKKGEYFQRIDQKIHNFSLPYVGSNLVEQILLVDF